MRLVIASILAVFAASINAGAYQQEKLPVIKSTNTIISIQDGDQYRANIWRLVPEIKPDVYEAQLKDGKPHRVTFVTDIDAISFWVELGKKYDFIIQRGDDLCYTQIIGVKYTPAAVFDQKYQAAYRGKMIVEVPEVYELVNIAIAMTPIGIEDRNLVYKDTEYYKRVREHFDEHKDHALLATLESELRQDLGRYFSLKMNGYSFEFDARGRIVQSKVYDRTGFRGDARNVLRPFLPLLQSFADETNFRKFYKENAATYQEQIAFYRETANIGEMKKWLDKNFPSSSGYDTYKIVFSPLVAYNQSTTWFDSNGFRELQPHVNFPYPQDVKRSYEPGTEAGMNVFRGNIVFTEINHGYINPEAEKYADRIMKAISNRERWVASARGPGYYAGIGTFNEYLNWGLVSLRLTDYAPRDEQARMIAAVDQMMTHRRGFLMFREFDRFLVNLYRTRPAGTTIADLYPQIIAWFERNNR